MPSYEICTDSLYAAIAIGDTCLFDGANWSLITEYQQIVVSVPDSYSILLDIGEEADLGHFIGKESNMSFV